MPPLRIMPPSVIKTAFSAKAQTPKVLKHVSGPKVGDVYKAVTTTKPQKTSIILNKIKNFVIDLLRD